MRITTQRKRTIMATLAAICGVAIVILLGVYDPATHPAPRCLFKSLTDLDCPGCGSQRAIHALVHGDIAAAWHYNAAIFFAIPIATIYIIDKSQWRHILYSAKVLSAIIASIILWWIIRNII